MSETMRAEDSVGLKGHVEIYMRDVGNNVPDWVKVVDQDNLIVTTGHGLVRDLLSGANQTDYLKSFAFGTGTTSPAAGNTGLETPVAYSGSNIYKVFLTYSNPSSVSTKYVGFFSASEPVTQPVDLTECGLFTGSLTTAGTMLCRITFAAITKTTTLELRLEYTITS